MKNFKLFSAILFVATIMALTGCETSPNNGNNIGNNNPENNIVNNVLGENEEEVAFNTVKSLANLIDKGDAQIQSTNIRRLDYTNVYGNDNEIPGFSVSFSGIAYDNVPNVDRIFDGRHLEYVGDGVLSSIIEYRRNGVVCYIHSFPEKEIPYELMNREGDYDDDEYDKAWDDFIEDLSYEIKCECGNLPEGTISHEDKYFDIFQEQGTQQTRGGCYAENGVTICKDPLIPEPFWSAVIRGNNLAIFNEYGINGIYYFSEFSKDGDSVTFEGYDNVITITKQECTDYAGGKHDYSATLVIEGDMVYAGCAEKSNMGGLIIGEQGFLSTFNKKTGLDIVGGEDTRYEVMEMLGNYVQVSIDNYVDEEFSSNQMLLEHKSDGWKILYEGDYTADSDTCEELNQYDMDLMKMSLFYNCPRG